MNFALLAQTSSNMLPKQMETRRVIMLDKISLVLVIIGAINWALIGVFQFDLVAYLFGGQAAVFSRIVYTLVGAAGLWCISMLFGERARARE
jgi:uncharacterized membrane protein YuzA (DUF378 family)